MTLIDALRAELITAGIVRAPNEGAGARPWLPPAWKHPDDGAVGPGDATDEGKPQQNRDDGLVLSLMHAPGIPPAAGLEELREDGADIIFRGTSVPVITSCEAAVRDALLGEPPYPGGRTDWMMGGLYVIQSRQWRAFQPISSVRGVFTFSVGYLFVTRA